MIDDTYKNIWSCSVRSHPKDFNKQIKELPVPADKIQVAIEPVGPWRWITTILEESGMDVHIANPRKVRLIAESTQKYDKNDAYMLAKLLQAGYFPEARKVPEEIYELRLLLRERQHIVRMRISTINRLHGVATTQGLHKITYGNPVTKVGKASIMSSNNLALQELHLLIEDLDKRITGFNENCVRQAETLPLAKLLMTIPGVGVITALTVLAEVGNFNDFPDPKKLAAYAGLVPRQRSSGNTTHYGSITHQGSPYLRSSLVECAMRIHHKGAPELYTFVERLKPTTGAKKARVALARKLLVIMWSMVINNRPYDPKMVLPASVCNTTLSKLDTRPGT
jgi:transposase